MNMVSMAQQKIRLGVKSEAEEPQVEQFQDGKRKSHGIAIIARKGQTLKCLPNISRVFSTSTPTLRCRGRHIPLLLPTRAIAGGVRINHNSKILCAGGSRTISFIVLKYPK